MKFIDENSLNRLNFKELLSRIDMYSGYGKNKLNNLSNFLVGEENKLEEEFERMEKIYNLISDDKREMLKLEMILYKFDNIRKTIENAINDIVLDTVDLFELKVQLMAMIELNLLLNENRDVFSDFILEDMGELFGALDPNNEKIATFYIYESYSVILKEIRRQKKEVENKLFNETDYETIQKLKNERLSILVDEEREEFKIRRNLTALVKKFSSIFLNNTEKIGNLDFVLGKVRFAKEYNGIRPVVSKKKEIVLEDAINLEVKEVLEAKNKKYTPISIKLNVGTTMITGANMGGKSVALKTIAENVLLFQMGFFVFAKYASIPLLDFIFFVSDDMQDISKGLSTFGAEIIKLKEINSYVKNGTGLIVFDEFARGTNPKEGQKFVRALAKYLNEKSSISIITTHFDSVVEKNMKHYQVVGLKNLDFESLKNRLKANNSLELIQDNMDFTLEESIETEVPKDALNIAKLIGLDDEISEMIYKEYEWEEQ
ncbi:endonuclease MutS2 [Fusobacterium nucleatum subsp. nucleatum ATCC 25586]|uniref:DNA mismatch repair protein mutS n=1 Tax=Fusobacterium nucleatum subsp. nucleatum (strain ATCC 25586 / DSM 15643 / BCRC 10681 / CIP 101130 / JCM 8532 / KCTC 2640 / LMG 13131 / VPI 4355) TaxID=190304 RepID=Q8RHX6_FUSNN|nr:endonuclease MutS2 [Fusobacterium nucleatum]AAL93963.1 DNA mismatch repair protein mutS [Fusobacterium nucleatum subsp. nucleatum ATCC 25586]AVQ14612.1 endonuclease MutS2 [Fusobacterium nucleatum subsp. nucleatum ATCC 25586]WMS29429.1 endonuclease MutS2 [Fusobacterium nucleatum]